MASIKEIKGHMRSVSQTLKITEAMYLVSTARLRTAKPKMLACQEYLAAREEALGRVLQGWDESWEGSLLVAVTADKGLAGDFIKNVSLETYRALNHNEGAELLLLGQAGAKYFRAHSYSFELLDYAVEQPETEAVKRLAEELLQRRDGRRILLLYNGMDSHSRISPREKQLWPPVLPQAEEETEYYPSREAVLERLLTGYTEAALEEVLWESFTAEQQSRMLAMQTASDNGKELLDQLTLKYNHVRQNAITQEIVEISGERRGLEE